MITKDDIERFDERRVGPCYFRRLNGDYLLTNDAGRYCMLDGDEFSDYMRGQVAEGSPLHSRLKENGFLREWLDFDRLSKAWKGRHSFLEQAPSLHIVVPTLRCNHKCVYCQAGATPMDDASTDMTEETARRVLDRIFESPSPAVMIEFQGGEPLANWPVVEFIVSEARRRNRKAKKKLVIGIVSNLSLMDKGKLDFLMKHGVTFCTSLDGPADLHDSNRVFLDGNSHVATVKWWGEIFRRTRGKKYRIDGLITVTKASLKRPRDIVDEYRGLGARGVYLRFLSPLGLAKRTWEKIGYRPEEFLAFYREAMDYIVSLSVRNKKVRFFEQTAKVFLTKILANVEPNNLDIRSPCGAGIGQIAYNHDGSIYTCDEGRMMSRMGDESFRIGHVGEGDYAGTVGHPVVRTLATASVLEAQPLCSHCAYKPYCGVCPIHNYIEQGDIFGKMLHGTRCRIYMGVMDYLFEKLKDDKTRAVFERWIAKSGDEDISRRY
ncbi:His-Xaa-Ser system radical SAM maturase HxsB [Elusimicrobiota bacterium]